MPALRSISCFLAAGCWLLYALYLHPHHGWHRAIAGLFVFLFFLFFIAGRYFRV
jgi:hypothetical protein